MRKLISIILSTVIFITSTITFSYAEKKSKEGFIECYNMNTSQKYECPVIVKDNILYMDTDYISKISGYSIEKNDGYIDFFKSHNKNSSYNFIKVFCDDKEAWSCENKYKLENVITQNNKIYLPLEQILYLMHSQWTVNKGILGVKTPTYDLYDFIETRLDDINENIIKDDEILIDGEGKYSRAFKSTLSTVLDDFSPTLFIPFYGGQKFEQDQYETVLLGLCQDDEKFLDKTSKRNIEKLLKDSSLKMGSESLDALSKLYGVEEGLKNIDVNKNLIDEFYKNLIKFDGKDGNLLEINESTPSKLFNIAGGTLTVWQAIDTVNQLQNRTSTWTDDYLNQIEVIANSNLDIYNNASYMKNAKKVAQKLIAEKKGKYNKALNNTLNTMLETVTNTIISATPTGKLVGAISLGTSITKSINPNVAIGLDRGKLSTLLKSTLNITAIGYSEMNKSYSNLYIIPNKNEQEIKNLRSSIVLLLRSNIRAKEYIYYLKSDDKWDYGGEKNDLKARIEKDYALLCELSETSNYDKALEINSDFKSIYSEENGKYRVNIIDSGIKILQEQKIIGTVVNKNKSQLKNVTITFTNNKTKKQFTSTTNSNGVFSKTLKPGTYTLEISKDGYESKKITVEVNDSSIDLGKIILNKEENLYKNYIGYWGYTEEVWHGGTRPATYSCEVNIKSINGNNILFDYVEYQNTGMIALGKEGNNIKSVINNGKVEFICLEGNLTESYVPKEKSSAKFYLKNGKVYVSEDCVIEHDYLVKGGKKIIIDK